MATVEQERSRVGQPRVLDEMKRREICALVSMGASMKTAAEYVGCSYVTVYRERQRDEKFRMRLARARATRQLAPLQMMRQAAKTHWRAAAWLLERSDPEQYGRRRPRAFGAQELRALKRDLLDIFDSAIDRPDLRAEVTQQMQATINYAMHHAWDRPRTGKPLRRAMQLLDQREEVRPTRDPWDELQRSLDEFDRDCGLSSTTGRSWRSPSFERSPDPDLSKLHPSDSTTRSNDAENPARVDGNAYQSG